MRLPPRYVSELLELIQPICCLEGFVTVDALQAIIGKAGRVAYVVLAAKPFVSGLWGGFTGALNEVSSSKRSAPPGSVACRRVCYAACWVRALLSGAEDCPLSLERLVGPGFASPPVAGDWSIEFDASIYGGGAVLHDGSGTVKEFFSVVWFGDEASHLRIEPGLTKHQTFWVFSTLLLSLIVWGDRFVTDTVMVVGDNTAALTNALSLDGKGDLRHVARELSWRQARRGWSFIVGHLPSEHNLVADALSRVAMGHEWPALALASATQVSAPRLRDLWLAAPR